MKIVHTVCFCVHDAALFKGLTKVFKRQRIRTFSF